MDWIPEKVKLLLLHCIIIITIIITIITITIITIIIITIIIIIIKSQTGLKQGKDPDCLGV